MRTSERTLLASLGFVDADKKEPEHDLACRYLIQPDMIERIVMEVFEGCFPRSWGHRPPQPERTMAVPGGINTGCIEQVLTNHRDQMVGFIDAVVRSDGRTWNTVHSRSGREVMYAAENALEVGIEVKIKPTPLSDVIRQIKLYRQYFNGSAWVLATRYALSAADRQTLRNETIYHLQLGKGFDEYVAGLNRIEAAASVEF